MPPTNMTPQLPLSALVLVSLGSNLGDSVTLIQTAMDRLERLAGGPGWRSSLWSTPPVDCPPGSPSFINAALVLRRPTGLTPETWLRQTQALEHGLGRRPKVVSNEARPVDVDLIAWGEFRCTTPFLTLPHPRAQERRFVLEPLAELVPNLIWPGANLSVAELLARCPADPNFRKWRPD